MVHETSQWLMANDEKATNWAEVCSRADHGDLSEWYVF